MLLELFSELSAQGLSARQLDVLEIEMRRKRSIGSQPRSGPRDESEFISHVMQSVHAGDEIVGPGRFPVMHRRRFESQVVEPGRSRCEHVDQVEAVNRHALCDATIAKNFS